MKRGLDQAEDGQRFERATFARKESTLELGDEVNRLSFRSAAI